MPQRYDTACDLSTPRKSTFSELTANKTQFIPSPSMSAKHLRQSTPVFAPPNASIPLAVPAGGW